MNIAKTPEQCALSFIRARRLRRFLPLSDSSFQMTQQERNLSELITCLEEDAEQDLQFLSEQKLDDYTDWTPDGDPQNDFPD